jgi:hypothetical protein
VHHEEWIHFVPRNLVTLLVWLLANDDVALELHGGKRDAKDCSLPGWHRADSDRSGTLHHGLAGVSNRVTSVSEIDKTIIATVGATFALE